MGFVMRGVDNWAHGGGFAGGNLAALILDPVQRERPAHLLVALGCLLMTALAIAASLLKGLALLRG
jgi:hypothetical protein